MAGMWVTSFFQNTWPNDNKWPNRKEPHFTNKCVPASKHQLTARVLQQQSLCLSNICAPIPLDISPWSSNLLDRPEMKCASWMHTYGRAVHVEPWTLYIYTYICVNHLFMCAHMNTKTGKLQSIDFGPNGLGHFLCSWEIWSLGAFHAMISQNVGLQGLVAMGNGVLAKT